MKILLVCKEMIAYERTAIMLLSSNLKKEGHQVKAGIMKDPSTAKKTKQSHKTKSLLHSDAYERKPFTFTDSAQDNNNSAVPGIYDNVYKTVKDFNPDVIGYSVMTGEHYDVLKLNKRLKKDLKSLSLPMHGKFLLLKTGHFSQPCVSLYII